MAGKQHLQPTDNTGSSLLAQFPPRISLSSSVLASVLDLPPQPHISYSIYTVGNATATSSAGDPLDIIEQARRRIWQEYGTRPVVDSLLTSVRITRDSLALYLFALSSGDAPSAAETALRTLALDGLNLVDLSRFPLAGLYPCSVTCSSQTLPCPTCLESCHTPNRASTHSSTSQMSSACLLPRISLRRIYAQFVQALRNHLIDSITGVAQSSPSKGTPAERSAIRLKDGFLINPVISTSSSEWGTGWDHRHLQRTFTYCQLQIELKTSCILIHPILRSTHFLPLSNTLPLPAGTPIVLLPDGVPAYFINTYNGPAGGLAAQFDGALRGLGIGGWKEYNSADAWPTSITATYVIVWIAVQNKQGEDKGIRAIWPVSLCVAFSPAATHAPSPLSYIPELPAQLQASPPVTAHVPASVQNAKSSLRAFTPSLTASSVPSPVTETYMQQGSSHSTPRPVEDQHDIAASRTRAFPGPHSPTSDSLRAFKTLTIVNRDIRRIAGEVSGYVDAVAREREKERERLRRERDGSSARAGASPLKTEEKVVGLQHSHIPPAATETLGATTEATTVTLPTQEPLSSANAASVGSSSPDADTDVDVDIDVAQSLDTMISLKQDDVGRLLPAPEIIALGSHKLEAPSPPPTVPEATRPPDAPMADSNISFETFGTFDNGWNQGSGEFMNLDMGINNFDYSMGMDVNGDDGGTFNVDSTFTFTDDDFNFFDAPSARTTTTGSTVTAAPLSLADANAVNPGLHASGPGPPTASLAQGLPWVVQGVGEGFTPRSLDTPGSVPALPDLIPSTPTLTPPSHSLPVTPTVMLSDQPHTKSGRKSSLGSLGPSMFDPIPFAETHKLSDGKYAMGKFALPTPPDEEDRTHPIPIRHPFPRRSGTDWKSSYTAVTDPRVGIIRRLKQRRCQRDEDRRNRGDRMSPAWTYERDEWMSSSPYDAATDVDMDSARSASDDDEEDGLSEDDQDVEVASRAHTPPPSYLPPGPSLIPTHFCHTYLLPMSTPLRPPGASLAHATASGTGPMSVPTPVSPAAVLGDASAKSRTLEDAAQILVKELVENCVWESSWRAGALASYTARKIPSEVWQIDVQYVHQLLCSIQSLRATLDLRTAFSDEEVGVFASMQEINMPLLAVGKADSILQVLPSALRFWDKLGLAPRAGKKDISAFVLYEGGEEDKERQLSVWLENISAVYAAKGFGQHTPGHAPSCVRDGLVPIHLDAIRKTLTSFISSLPEPESPAVFYIVVPVHVISLGSQVLRRVLSAVKKAAKGSQNVSRVFELVPEPFVMGALDDPSMNHSGLELLASSLYDRLRVPSMRARTRSFTPDGGKNVCALFQEPAFILARPAHRKVKFLRETHASTLDVMDRHIFLHVAYLISSCGKWLFMAAIDQAGSAHDLRALLIPSDATESFVVSSVWNFALTMAMKANVEWHIIVAKLGFMTATEYDAWSSCLELQILARNTLPPLRVTLVTVEADSRWHFLPSEHVQVTKSSVSPSRVPKVAPGTGFCDVSSTTYILQPGIHTTLSVPCTSHLSPGAACILDPEDEKTTDELGMRPLSTTTLVRVPAGSDYTPISMLHLHVFGSVQSPNSTTVEDEGVLREIATNYHDLSVLARERWKLNANPILPFHLGALEVMQLALDRGDSMID